MTRYARIVSTGRYVPERRVTNAEISAIVGKDVDAWLRENVGIESRHYMADDQRTSDLCIEAAKQTLERAGVDAAALDLIIVATDTPDYLSPSTSVVVQHALGARRAGVFDLNAACAGWVTAFDQGAKSIVADPDIDKVLVIGAYGMSRYIDWTDKKTATLFADGAAAVLLEASDAPGVLGTKLAAEGSFHDALGIYLGGTAQPATREAVAEAGKPKVEFVRRFPPTFNVEAWTKLIDGLLDKTGLTLDDIDHYVFTQINARTIEATMDALGQPRDKAHHSMHKWGYVGSACIPMTLDDAVEKGAVSPGQHVLLCASGGGISMAASLVRWG